MAKGTFRVICPKCNGEDVHIYYSTYDEIVIVCADIDCRFREGDELDEN